MFSKNSTQLSVIFVGTGAFGVTILNSLASHKNIHIPFVITGEDKKVGRGRVLTASAIKQAAISNKLIVHTTSHIDDLKQKIIQAKPSYLLVIAYGEIIKKEILDLPHIAAINIHPSLLPKYRGASPIQQALLEGKKETGVTWIVMTEKMDAGPIIEQKKYTINDEHYYTIVSEKLSQIAADQTPEVLIKFAQKQTTKPQEEQQATYCKKIEKEDGRVNIYKETAQQIVNKIKAYTPWPGCSLLLNGKRIKIIQAEISEQKISTGKIVISNKSLLIGTIKQSLSLLRIQAEGKRVMSIKEFLAGNKVISLAGGDS